MASERVLRGSLQETLARWIEDANLDIVNHVKEMLLSPS